MSGVGERPRVFVATRFVDEVEARMAAAFDAHFERSGGEPIAVLCERARAGERFDALLCSLDLALSADAIARLPDTLSMLATYSVGTDHIDLEAARAHRLAVFNTPGVLADSVAENAFFLMLGAARRATESIALVRSGEWSGWTPTQLVGVQLAGRTLGILGMGDIGRRVAARAAAFGMQVLHHNRRAPEPGSPQAAGYRATPEALVAESDFLVLLCPSTPETRGLVDAGLLAAAKPGVVVVNVARGDVVDDDALVAALERGQVRAAGLDVFAGEPALDPRYLALPNAFLLPHIGSSTIEARLGMGQILIDAITAHHAGRPVANRVV